MSGIVGANTLEDARLLGALAGVGLALGVWLLISAARRARPRLSPRIDPYLRAERPRPVAAVEVRGPLGAVARFVAPFAGDGARLLERLGSSNESIRRRLHQLGSRAGVEQFRLEQAAWSALAVTVVLLACIVGRSSLFLGVVAVAFAAVTGALARDRLLSRAVEKRKVKLQEQLPDIAEMLALAVGAGESAAGALDRVASTARGELADELRLTVAESRAGTPLTSALSQLAARTQVPALTRFAEGVSVAVERGTPLADVLRAQAADARAGRRQELMELGGKKEISMMAPVVFLILPVTVIFALFPGLAVLQVSV